MVGKNQIKLIRSLQQKKYRNRYGMFVAEGVKTVGELVNGRFKMEAVYTSSAEEKEFRFPEAELVLPSDIQRMSNLKTAGNVLAIFHIPEPEDLTYDGWILGLDRVQDPGNLGTIIRLCDWFGIEHLVCSPETADCYNPKALQASMGSIARVNVVYSDLVKMIREAPVAGYGTFMGAPEVYNTDLPEKGILIMGNEGQGISDAVGSELEFRLGIPSFGKKEAESLNVAMATAIMLSEIRRR